ncbi:hypothetical protein SLEP1_g33308 [Rubroshorea leprosula]|uniref:Mandelate racemase/muconate lactonizing enzyme N-terminal domain-containing protein n=1 Tax=Rubroshorea leprosula TaxID=152421 RepID=A0AAV5KGD5_9ROSI|nr:hypothetical protein SLEP1_g33308 [Rubroshorea leprosula]
MAAPAAVTSSFGFNNLMETFSVEVHRAENRPLNVPLIAPFTIASSRLDKVENVAIRIELRNGCVGWGESPILPFVTAEDQTTAMAKASEACQLLRSYPAMTLGAVLREIGGLLPGHEFASNICVNWNIHIFGNFHSWLAQIDPFMVFPFVYSASRWKLPYLESYFSKLY